jgi:uncharacterized protein with beta-barrel porin domain
VSLLALAAAAPAGANDDCSTSGTEQTCSGDQSGGITVVEPVTKLIVDNITGDITGAGISFQSIGQVSIDSDTGAFKIDSTGDGISAVATGDTPDAWVAVVQNGDIQADDDGIYAQSSNHTVTVNNTGDITAAGDGIFANSIGLNEAAYTAVTNAGDITAGGYGIYANSANQTVTVDSSGDIAAGSDGIYANSVGLSEAAYTTVTNVGDITSTAGRGIYAQSSNQTVTVDNDGDITASGDGIFANSIGSSEAAYTTVTNVGDITSTAGRGIYAQSSNQTVTVDNNGDITANGDGLYANSIGESAAAYTTVTNVGDISSTVGLGIYAQSSNQTVTVDNDGDITAKGDGIFANSIGVSDAAYTTVTNVGDINSTTGRGIYAKSANQTATVDNAGDITASGDGIFAQSTGVSDASHASVTNVGDVNSSGGRGIFADSSSQTVTVDNDGDITAAGDGIYAKTTGVSDAAYATVTQNGDITAGGYGIYANSATQTVTVDNIGDIIAVDDGIFAQSTGVSAASYASVTNVGDINSSAGRGIYAQSSSQTVTVDNDGDITAAGDGIYANTAGISEAAYASVTQDGDITAGGYGIYASSATRTVTVDNIGDIIAVDDGIFAQSTGNAVSSYVSVTNVGDINSSGGRGIYAQSSNYTVTVDNDGDITSAGDGIYANATGSAEAAYASVTQVGDITAGGYGIYASSANQTVTVDNIGDITAVDDGIFAQSTGSSTASYASVTNVGDINSSAGRGIYAQSSNQTVTVDNDGDITAAGDGIYANTTGSSSASYASVTQDGDITAGGYGIYASSATQTAIVDNTGDITAVDDGIFAQTTGNSSASHASVTNVGDINSSAGRGIYAQSSNQTAIVDNDGDITAAGDGIYANTTGVSEAAYASVTQQGDITAGGFGIYASSATQTAIVNNIGDIIAVNDGIFAQSTGVSAASHASVLNVGDITSSAGRGIYAQSSNQTVIVDNDGDITSLGDGIFAQSTGDSVASHASVTNEGDINSSTGRGIYAYSARQTVNVTNSGDISSAGEGIFAQSHGDAEGATVTVNQTGDIDSGITGIYAASPRQAVNVTSTGDIDARDFGVFAQTTGDAIAATARISHTGDVTMQANGIGLYAEASVRAASVTASGDITGGRYGIKTASLSTSSSVTLNGGSVSGASIAAVSAASITGATVTNYGTIDGGNVTAIEVSGASSKIENHGTLIGNVISVRGIADVDNETDGLFRTGALVDLNGGTLTNDGTLEIGKATNTIATTALDGKFVQSSLGLMKVDVDLSTDTSDLLDVSGSADLNGDLFVNVTDFGGQSQTVTIIKSDRLISENLNVTNVVLNDVVQYIGDDVVLTLDDADFGAGALSGNDRNVGDGLKSAFMAGSSDMSGLLGALVNFTDADAYAEALAQLSPEMAATSTMTVVNTNMQFTNKLMSCKTYTSGDRVNREGECSWVAAEGFTVDYSPSDSNAAYDTSGYMLGTGFQAALSDVWRAGLGFSYAHTTTNGDLDSDVDSNQLAVGAVVKYDAGPLLLAADVTAGYIWSEASRRVDIEGFSDSLSSDTDGKFLGGRLRAAYTSEIGHAYVQPLVDLDVTYYAYDGFTESGGEAALEVEGHNELVTTLSPALEIGGDFVGKNGLNYRPYMRAGAILNPNPETSLAASFVGAEAGSGAFEITSETDGLLGTFAFGMDVITPGNGFGRLVYEGQLGENTESHSLAFKLGAPF